MNAPNLVPRSSRPTFTEFFAGSGLVSLALAPFFQPVWVNDICPKKAAVYRANHDGTPFTLNSIVDVHGADLPAAALSWASFPCQDLSLAGNGAGIRAKRSGLAWEWLRVIDEMRHRPPVLAAENVAGLVSAHNGAHYRALHQALTERGYLVGAMLLDAVRWLPHSRPRVFVVAVDRRAAIPPTLLADGPTWAHNPAVCRAAQGLEHWVWWRLPEPAPHRTTLSDLLDLAAPCHDAATSRRNLSLIPAEHLRRLQQSPLPAVPGYKRTRHGRQVLELRFDDVAGCLRTPAGGSSRQMLVVRRNAAWHTRILTPREAARLMGAPDAFLLPGTNSDGYKAMGDAVAAPVAAHLAEHLLVKLAQACAGLDARQASGTSSPV